MKINIIHMSGHGSLSGGYRSIADYAEFLQERGHDVSLVSPKLPGKQILPGPIGRRLPFRHAPVYDTTFSAGRAFTSIVSKRTAPLLADDVPDADITVATWWRTAQWVADLPASKGIKAYLMQDYGASNQPMDALIETWRMGLHMITISTFLEDLVQERVPQDIHLVTCGIDTDKFAPSRATKDPSQRLFGFLYSNKAQKGSDLAMEALRIAKAAEPRIEAVAFGRGAATDPAMPDFVSTREGLSDDEVTALYAQCNAWLFTTRKEGFGLPILEAMASGTPVIATRAGAAPDLVEPTDGALVDWSAEAVAEEILRFARMGDAALTAMGTAARAKAKTQTLDAAAHRFEAALVDIAAR